MPYISTIARASANGLGYSGAEPAIGQPFQGGYYAGAYQVSGQKYYLIIAPIAAETRFANYWTGSNPNISATSEIDGFVNTQSLVAGGQSPAATHCDTYTNDGYTDWYLPARWEFEIVYYNLKPSATDNSTTNGANPYAIPSRVGINYTTTIPTQTSVGLFQSGNPQALTSAPFYWSSTEATLTTRAYATGMTTGQAVEALKTQSFYGVRPVRKVYAGSV